MELRQLTTFIAIAQTGSFTRAAERLGYVQSNVTAHIQALESELEVVLFDRLGRQVRLTAAGRRLEEYAGRILSLANEAHDAVSNAVGGEVVISASETLCTYRLPALLRLARRELADVRVVFRPLPSNSLRQHVSRGEIDMAVTLELPTPTHGLHVEPLAHEEILVVAPPDHPLTMAGTITPTAMEGASMLLTEAGCAYRVAFEQALATAGVATRETLEFGSVEAIKQCVMGGMGLAVLPAVAVAREVAAGELVALPWSGPSLTMTTQLIWNARRWCSPTLKAFVTLARQTLSSTSP